MKRLIRSLVIASGGLFIAATASDAAKISFTSTPEGFQRDTDPISDIKVGGGQIINFEVLYNAEDIELSDSVEIDFSIDTDPGELALSIPDGAEPAFGSGFQFKKIVPLNMAGSLINFQTTASNNLSNDGISDVVLALRSVYIMENRVVNGINVSVRGRDITRLFGGTTLFGGTNSQNTQKVEVQSDGSDIPIDPIIVPEPTTIFGSALALGVGGWLKRKKLSQQNKTTPPH